MIKATKLKRRILQTVSRTKIHGDALEAIAFHPRLFARLAGRLRSNLPAGMLEQPLLFIHIPKNAGTSIATALYGHETGHRSIRYYSLANSGRSPMASSFAVLRHPVERFLSSYDFFKARGGDLVKIYPEFMRDIEAIDTIDDYLRYIARARRNWLRVDNPARPQWWYVTDSKGRIAVDKLFVLEADMDQIDQLVHGHCGRRIPHINRTARRTFSLPGGQLDAIERLFRLDFALYRFVTLNASNPAAACGRSLKSIEEASR